MARRLLVAEGDAPSAAWSGGAAQYWTEREAHDQVLVVAARCRLGELEVEDLALLDTGAEWSVIGGELAELVLGQAHDTGDSITMSTRLGRVKGRLHRLSVTVSCRSSP